MHLDVHRKSVKSLIPPIAWRRLGTALFAVVVCGLIVPQVVHAGSNDANTGAHISMSLAETSAEIVHYVDESHWSIGRPQAWAPLDPPAPDAPPPPVQRGANDLAVELSTTNGQMLLRSAASAAKATSAITSTVRVAAGNVRLAPDIGSAIVGSVHNGDVLNVHGVSEGWYLVSLSDQAASTSSITGEVAWVSQILIDAPERPPLLAASPASAYRWLAATDASTIYDTGGVLHLRITDAQAQRAVSSSVMGRASELAPAKAISFTLTLHWAKGHAPGGSIFHTILGDGRDLQMRVGPGEGYPWAEFAVDDQVLPDSGTGFPLYTPTPVQFTWTGTEVVASIAGEERARVPVTTPMTSLRIAIEAQPGCIFHLTVGDMTVVSN